jgi:hypothetical protein
MPMAVYFVQAVDGGPIKIGYTENLTVRVKQLEATYARSLALLRAVEGGRIEEHAIHCQFAHLRLGRTEQFRPAPELLDFIGRPLFNAGRDEITAEAMPTVAGVTLLNLKGSERERDYVHELSMASGVPMAEIVRRGIAMWASSRGISPPANWVIE